MSKMRALLFNLDNKELLNLLKNLNIESIIVDKNKYNQRLIDILNNTCTNKLCLNTFNDEMIVFVGFNGISLDILLKALKSNNISIPLKAVLTEYNMTWTPLYLKDELVKEHNQLKNYSNRLE